MDLKKQILKLLKDQPMNRLSLIKFLPEENPQSVSGVLNSLLINNKVSYDGHDYLLPKKRSKYGNKITEVDGIKFDSKLEAKRYVELTLLEKAGKIKDLERQVPFIVADEVPWNGEILKAIKYRCDFKYHDNETGEDVVEDSKGAVTALYKLKRSLFINRYPEYSFREIKA